MKEPNNNQTTNDSPCINPCSPLVFCEAELKDGKKIRAEHSDGMFRFSISDGWKTCKIEMSDDAARVIENIISAMLPHDLVINDQILHQTQEQRKILYPRITAHP